jgi:hypothetical protein
MAGQKSAVRDAVVPVAGVRDALRRGAMIWAVSAGGPGRARILSLYGAFRAPSFTS